MLGWGHHSGTWPLIIALHFTITLLAEPRTYVVSPRGDDRNPGTQEEPLRTIAQGVLRASPGDTILLKDGIYRSEGYVSDGTGGWYGYASPVVITKAGTPQAWYTIRAEHRGGAILDCETSEQRRGCDVYIYLKNTAAYWAFEDLVVTGGAYAGINTNEGAHDIRITGTEFHHIGNRTDNTRIGIVGVGFGPETAVRWWIENNVFHDIGRISGPSENLDHAIYAGGADATIDHNVFYRNLVGWHIQTTKGAQRWLIANNTFAVPSLQENGHVMLWDGNVAGSISDIEIRDNIFFNVRGPAVVSFARSIPGCVIQNNLTTSAGIFDYKAGCDVRNNRVNTDPEFLQGLQEPFDFQLSDRSPALGAGKDGEDLGAFRRQRRTEKP